ncbi:hypothetical protein DFH28DRAFT_961717 [Melampsora americana]|nr:hypothetical protein DFH28DRAFT_961717 [Melampsora americana]
MTLSEVSARRRQVILELITFHENLETEPNQKSAALDFDWYPFTKKQTVGFLLLGSGHHLLSEKQYEKGCPVFKLFNISLPVYRTLGRLRKKMCPQLGLNVVNWDSALENPCYSLSIKDIVAQNLPILLSLNT